MTDAVEAVVKRAEKLLLAGYLAWAMHVVEQWS